MKTPQHDRISETLTRCCKGIPDAAISRFRREYSAYAEDCSNGKFSGDFGEYARRYVARDPGILIEVHTRLIRQITADEDSSKKKGHGFRI